MLDKDKLSWGGRSVGEAPKLDLASAVADSSRWLGDDPLRFILARESHGNPMKNIWVHGVHWVH